MIPLIINLYRLFKYTYLALRQDSEFKSLLIFTIFLLIGSTIFYVNNEGWSVIDAIYFSMMTMSTIGYGDFVPSSTLSKIFTIVYTFLSIGAFVSLTAKIVTVLVDKKRKHHKNEK